MRFGGVGFPSEKFSPKLTVQWRDTRPPDIDTDGSSPPNQIIHKSM